jgi:hypothetical protein
MNAGKEFSAFEVYVKTRKHIQPILQFKKNKFDGKNLKHMIKKKYIFRKLCVKNICSKNTETWKKTKVIKSKKLYNNKSTYKFKNGKKYILSRTKNVQDNNLINLKNLTDFDKVCSDILNSVDKLSDPINESEKLFEWLIYPLQKDEFFM